MLADGPFAGCLALRLRRRRYGRANEASAEPGRSALTRGLVTGPVREQASRLTRRFSRWDRYADEGRNQAVALANSSRRGFEVGFCGAGRKEADDDEAEEGWLTSAGKMASRSR